MFWGFSGVVLGLFWACSEVVLFWAGSEVVLGLFWGCSGCSGIVLGFFWARELELYSRGLSILGGRLLFLLFSLSFQRNVGKEIEEAWSGRRNVL